MPFTAQFFIAPNPASCAGIYFPKFYGLSPEWLTSPGGQRFGRRYKAWVLQGSAAEQHIPCIICKDEPLEMLSFHTKKSSEKCFSFFRAFFHSSIPPCFLQVRKVLMPLQMRDAPTMYMKRSPAASGRNTRSSPRRICTTAATI